MAKKTAKKKTTSGRISDISRAFKGMPSNGTEAIFKVLMRQDFANWYADDGDFGKFIAGDEDAPTKAEIMKQIAEMFGRVW